MKQKSPVDFIERVAKGMAALGSADHVGFSIAMATWRKKEKLDYVGFTNLLTDIIVAALAPTKMDRTVQLSVTRDMVPFTVGSAWWADLGFPVFNLTHDFFRAVSVTDFGDVGDEPMHQPFPAYLVRLPESLRGNPTALPMFLYPVPTKAEDGGLGFSVSRLSIASEPNDNRAAYTQWTEGIPFAEFVSGRTVKQQEDVDPVEKYTTQLLGAEMDPQVTQRARRTLGNTLLYINANGGLPSEKRIGADVPVEREHQTDPRFRIGRPIKLGPKLRSAIHAASQGGASWKLESRFVVRGHWRNQAHGPDRSLRRRQWIQPYYKGPEGLTDALERTFEVA
jgi:hypothetical protein